MHKISSIFSTNKILLIIIFIAVLLRFIGISPGHPPYHADEGMSYAQAVGMIKEKTLDAHGYSLAYAYPTAVPLINALIFGIFFIPIYWLMYLLSHIDQINSIFTNQKLLETVFQMSILGPREINALSWGRYVTALFGVGVVIITYFLSRLLFNKPIALIAAFLIAINFRHVLNSHIGLPDIYNSFFLLLTLYFTFRIFLVRSSLSYLLAGISAALTFSTKFQFFPFLPIIFVEIVNIFRKQFKFKNIILYGFSVILIVVLLNPYHIINWEKTYEQLYNVSLKYKVGVRSLDYYPIFYLIKFGIGVLLFPFVLLGILILVLKEKLKAFYLLIPFLASIFIFAYYSGGGFYTRNLLPIIPILLIFAAYLFYYIFIYFRKVLGKNISGVLVIFLITISSWSMMYDSVVAVSSYSKQWNFRTLQTWLNQNITTSVKISAHSSVPLNDNIVTRLRYEVDTAYSLEEFREIGADYAIANLDVATNDFYYWMRQNTEESLKYWEKPIDTMEQMYPALALRELSDFSIYSVMKPWQAPESNFIVSAIPKFSVSNMELKKSFTFTQGLEGWGIAGKENNREEENLSIGDQGLMISGATRSPIARWESSPIYLDSWNGFYLVGDLLSKSEKQSGRESYLAISFYNNFEDAKSQQNKVGVRLTSRNSKFNEWVAKEVSGNVPKNARFATISFRSYGTVGVTNYLKSVELYKAMVTIDSGKFVVNPIWIDNNLIFPNSHGNL